MNVGEYSCDSRTTNEGSFLVAFLHSHLCYRLTTETKSPVKCRETQSSFEVDNDIS